jgi:hypothetical protein
MINSIRKREGVNKKRDRFQISNHDLESQLYYLELFLLMTLLPEKLRSDFKVMIFWPWVILASQSSQIFGSKL